MIILLKPRLLLITQFYLPPTKNRPVIWIDMTQGATCSTSSVLGTGSHNCYQALNPDTPEGWISNNEGRVGAWMEIVFPPGGPFKVTRLLVLNRDNYVEGEG